MEKAAPDIFKVDDEDGMVALYKKVQQSNLAVTLGELWVPAKLLGHAKVAEAADIPWFKEIVASATATETGEAA